MSPSAREMRRAGPILGAVWRFTGGAAVGIGLGLLLDGWLNTSPWLVLVGMSVGMGTGFYAMYRGLGLGGPR